jgi:hypothetical protein
MVCHYLAGRFHVRDVNSSGKLVKNVPLRKDLEGTALVTNHDNADGLGPVLMSRAA